MYLRLIAWCLRTARWALRLRRRRECTTCWCRAATADCAVDADAAAWRAEGRANRAGRESTAAIVVGGASGTGADWYGTGRDGAARELSPAAPGAVPGAVCRGAVRRDLRRQQGFCGRGAEGGSRHHPGAIPRSAARFTAGATRFCRCAVRPAGGGQHGASNATAAVG